MPTKKMMKKYHLIALSGGALIGSLLAPTAHAQTPVGDPGNVYDGEVYAVCRTAGPDTETKPTKIMRRATVKGTTLSDNIFSVNNGSLPTSNSDCTWPIDILSSDRTVYAISAYSGSFLDTSNPPPQVVDINEIDEQTQSYDLIGVWDQTTSTGVLQNIFGTHPDTDPITASASQQSIISTSGGSVSIDLFSDQYWGSSNPNLLSGPSGNASSRGSYFIEFSPSADSTLSFEGFLSTNFATIGSTNVPKGVARLTVTHISTNTNVLHVQVNPNSTVVFNDLHEVLDGTNIALTGGEIYEMTISALANSDAQISPSNSEGEIDVTWEIQ